MCVFIKLEETRLVLHLKHLDNLIEFQNHANIFSRSPKKLLKYYHIWNIIFTAPNK